jgi:anti-sigma factor RsiW
MNYCRFEVYLSGLLDSELSENDTQFVKNHLGECAHCRTTLKKMEKVKEIAEAPVLEGVCRIDWNDILDRILRRIPGLCTLMLESQSGLLTGVC